MCCKRLDKIIIFYCYGRGLGLLGKSLTFLSEFCLLYQKIEVKLWRKKSEFSEKIKNSEIRVSILRGKKSKNPEIDIKILKLKTEFWGEKKVFSCILLHTLLCADSHETFLCLRGPEPVNRDSRWARPGSQAASSPARPTADTSSVPRLTNRLWKTAPGARPEHGLHSTGTVRSWEEIIS